MDAAALVISIVAVLIAGASVWFTRQQAVGARDQAREAKRANDRIDADRAAAEEDARLEAEQNRYRWELVRVSSNLYDLINYGSQDAHEVTVTPTAAALLTAGTQRSSVQQRLVRARGDKLRLGIVKAGDFDNSPAITVIWSESDEPEVLTVP